MNRRSHWEPLFLACVAVCLDAQCQKRGITCLWSKTHPPWHLTGQWRDIIARVWISDTALSQQMRAGRHSAPQQLCLLTSSVINGGYKVHGNDVLHHHTPLHSPWQRSDPQLMWRCLLFRWFLFNPVSLCVGAVCGCDMARSGFFMRNGDYLCPLDFQRLHGTPCNNCREFVEGEVVTVLGKTYHPACFVCNICKSV